MSDVGFGIPVHRGAFEHSVDFVVRILRQAKKTNFLDAKAILFEAYETGYGIFDYLDHARKESMIMDANLKRPLVSVAMHFAEDFTSTSKYRETARLFAEKRVHTHFGLSWDEFLDLTPDKCEDILLICTERERQTGKDAAAAADALKAAQAQLAAGRS